MLRRYGMFGFLFTLCLVAVLNLSGNSALTQSLPASNSLQPSPQFMENAPISSQPTSQPATPTPPAALSLTQGVRKTVLDNGLTVLTKEIHTAPVVSVQVWYRVGSRNETAGINGISHQLEHLMFKGTATRPIQFGRLFSALGSQSNAFTSYDQTAYFGTVERDKLDALLVLEADRMQGSLITDEHLTSEKRVVISELQGYENSPGYRLSRAVMRAAFPDLPYGLPVGGTKSDVEKFTLEQVESYYRKYYSPGNATLIIAGDFKTDPTLEKVKAYYGKIPKGNIQNQPPAPQAPPIAKDAKPREPIVLRQAGSAPLLQAIYPLPNVTHPDVAALDLLDGVLTGGRSSRLYQSLVETGLASDVGGYAANLIGTGWYNFSVTAAPNQALAKIDQVLQQEIVTLQTKAVTEEELNRAKTQIRSSVLLQNRDVTSQAQQLGNDQTIAGDYTFTDRYLAAMQTVTAADVQRVAKTYFQPASRTVGYFEPTQPDGQPGATGGNFSQTAENFSPGAPVDPAEVAKYLPAATPGDQLRPQALPDEFTLPNGLQVLLFPDRSSPTVTLSGYVRAGTEFDQPDRAGLSSFTASNLMNGTQSKDALELAKILENRGAGLGFSANREGVGIGGSALSTDLPVLLETLTDVLQNANFPADELELSRNRSLTALKVELDSPARLGRRVFQQAVYPANHPFHNFPTEESLKRVTRGDLVQFHKTHYRPDTTILTLVGDFDSKQVRTLLEKGLGTWKASGQAPKVTFPTVALPPKLVRLTPSLPGKTQSITYLGYGGIDRRDPRYYTVLVMNQILGGDTLSSRLGTEIRDRQGLTYGIYSYFQAGRESGPFLIQMQTAPEDAEKAINSTVQLLQQLRDQGVTANEVAAAKRSLTSSYPVELADPDNLAGAILMNEVYGLDKVELRQFSDKIQAVTLNQVNQSIKELLYPDRLVIVTAGPGVSAAK